MNYTALMSAIKLMGQGMFAIFIVMSIIAFVIYLSIKLANKDKP